MSLPLFFLDDQVLAAECEPVFPLRLSAEDAKHARVLRIAPGEHIAVVDADADRFECEVVDASGDVPLVSIARREGAPAQRARITLLQGLAKGDKMDAIVRQATELGVAAIWPLECERSVVRLDARKAEKRTERWRAIAKSAAMQSGQPRIPEVARPQALEAALPLLMGATAVLICWEEAPATALLHEALASALQKADAPAADARIALVVGPEGGLDAREVDALLACNPHAHLISLGPSILRTETAGVVAPALLLYELARMGGA